MTFYKVGQGNYYWMENDTPLITLYREFSRDFDLQFWPGHLISGPKDKIIRLPPNNRLFKTIWTFEPTCQQLEDFLIGVKTIKPNSASLYILDNGAYRHLGDLTLPLK